MANARRIRPDAKSPLTEATLRLAGGVRHLATGMVFLFTSACFAPPLECPSGPWVASRFTIAGRAAVLATTGQHPIVASIRPDATSIVILAEANQQTPPLWTDDHRSLPFPTAVVIREPDSDIYALINTCRRCGPALTVGSGLETLASSDAGHSWVPGFLYGAVDSARALYSDRAIVFLNADYTVKGTTKLSSDSRERLLAVTASWDGQAICATSDKDGLFLSRCFARDRAPESLDDLPVGWTHTRKPSLLPNSSDVGQPNVVVMPGPASLPISEFDGSSKMLNAHASRCGTWAVDLDEKKAYFAATEQFVEVAVEALPKAFSGETAAGTIENQGQSTVVILRKGSP